MSPALLIATANPGKAKEIAAVLSDLPCTINSLADFSGLEPVIEDQDSFLGNARKKATHYAARTGLMTLADDSGLEVDCLGGRPGIHSARFAGDQKDDAANNAKLIRMLADTPPSQRQARFRCAVAVAGPPGILATAEGRIEGLIVDPPRGTNGFGYDPHFLVPELNQTMAELASEHKNRISHRGQALRRIRAQLVELIS